MNNYTVQSVNVNMSAHSSWEADTTLIEIAFGQLSVFDHRVREVTLHGTE